MRKPTIHIGELVWVVLLLGLVADLVIALCFQSDALRIDLLRVTPTASAASLCVGAALLVVGCILGHQSHEAFKRALSATGCIDYVMKSGLYRHIRHPFYLSLMIINLSLALLLRSLLVLAAWIVVAIMLLVEARGEEGSLIEKFGQEYLDYRRKTGMFLPRLGCRG